MRHHFIKCDAPYFERTQAGQKPFEIRKDDRDYQAGDRVTMAKIKSREELLIDHLPMLKIELVITYVTTYEQKKGYVVFAHKPFVEAEDSE